MCGYRCVIPLLTTRWYSTLYTGTSHFTLADMRHAWPAQQGRYQGTLPEQIQPFIDLTGLELEAESLSAGHILDVSSVMRLERKVLALRKDLREAADQPKPYVLLKYGLVRCDW